MLGLGSSLTSSGAVSEPLRVLVASYNLNDDTGSGTGSLNTTIPSGWAKGLGAAHTVFGTTTTKTGSGAGVGWNFTASATGSSNTGPGGGHVGGPDTLDTVITDGTWDTSTDHRYMHYEATGFNGFDSTDPITNIYTMRTDELDFSGYTSIEMTFWYHNFCQSVIQGTKDGYGMGLAVTTNTASASSAVEAGSGLGFTGFTAGGATMTYTDTTGASRSEVRLGGAGRAQTTGHTTSIADSNKWVKVTTDLSAAAGQSSVYIYFTMFPHAANNAFQQDISIDSIAIIGQ
jgi:hypothetical protein